MDGLDAGSHATAKDEFRCGNRHRSKMQAVTSRGPFMLRTWAAVLKNTYRDVLKNHMFEFAAALAFYFVLSLFPALIALSAVLGFLPVRGLFNRIIQMTPNFVPADSMGVVRGVVMDLLKANHPALFSFGLIATLWSATSGFASMIEAMNVAYDAEETRPLWKTRWLALVMTFVVGILVLAALTLMVIGPNAPGWLARAHLPQLATVWPILRWTASTVFIISAVEFTYFVAPNLRQQLRHTLIGAVLSVAAWLGLSYALSIYFQRFANLNATYGTLGGAIALMIWLYWSFFVVLLGAEINGESVKARRAAMQTKHKVTAERTAKPVRRDDAA
jgi:membrane protein